MTTPQKINDVYVFLSFDTSDNSEGIVAQLMPDPTHPKQNMFVPFVCSSRDRVDALMPFAKAIARETDMLVKLVKYSSRIDLEEVKGEDNVQIKSNANVR